MANMDTLKEMLELYVIPYILIKQYLCFFVFVFFSIYLFFTQILI